MDQIGESKNSDVFIENAIVRKYKFEKRMKFSLIAVEHMLIQQKYQTMYFDNYLKSNPSSLGQKLDQSAVSIFHQQSVNNLEPIQFKPRPYFNPRITENTNTPSPGAYQNVQQPPKHYIAYQTGPAQHNVQKQNSFQVKNNISFNTEQPTSTHNRDTSEFMKRRDSIIQNTFLRSNHEHSPSNGKSFVTENCAKTSVKLSMMNEQQRNNKYNGSSNILLNMTPKTYLQQEYSMNPTTTKEYKQTFMDKQDKSNYFNPSNYNQYGFSQTKASSKPYALGFKNSVQNFDADPRRTTLQQYPKERPLQEKEHMYNYQLKNTANELTSFNKPNAMGNQDFKYYTPSLAKKSSLKEDSNVAGKNGFSQLIDIRHNNNNLEREGCAVKENNNFTDREVHKSPSFDTLLIGTKDNNFRTKFASTLEPSLHPSQTNSKQSSQQSIINNPAIDNRPYTSSKPPSESFLLDPSSDKPAKQSTQNYHALIQNLEKKFSEQKKSTETFENKEKNYLGEMSKRDEKIKRLQTIIENNKETITALDETIRQLRKKIDSFKDDAVMKVDTVNAVNLSMIEQLKRENGGLKQELKKQRKKSVSLAEQAFQKQISQRQQLKIKQLQKALIESNNHRQSLSQQVSKLKESTSLIQDSYSQQVKQHQKAKHQLKQLQKVKDQLKEPQKTKEQLRDYQKTREQLQKAKQQIDQLTTNLKQKAQSFAQVKSVLLNLEQKYEGSLKKLLNQEDDFNIECSQLCEKVQNQRKQKQHLLEQIQKLRAKLQRLNGEIDFKSMKIKTLEEQLSEKETQLQKMMTSHQKVADSNQMSLNQTISICIQETKMAKDKLSFKQQAYEALAIQLSEKHCHAESLARQNSLCYDRIKSLEAQLQAIEVRIGHYETNKAEQNAKTSADSAEFKTFCSDSGQQSPQLREALSLIELYHQKYTEIVTLFNLTQSAPQKSVIPEAESLIFTPHQNSQSPQPTSKLHPSRQYLAHCHPLLSSEVKKVLKDMKKLLAVLKECQTDSQHKTQRLHELDKTLKKQSIKINQLLAEIHLKNISIIQINNMQVEKDIFRLNEKYQILSHVGLEQA